MNTFRIILIFILLSAYTAEAETLFVYNPEARVGRTEKIKSDLEDYLKSEGHHSEIYIYANYDDFQNSVGRLKPDSAIVASFCYSAMKEVYKWKLILSGYNSGAKSFNKVLVTPLSVSDPLQLKTKSVATVNLGLSSAMYIESQLPQGLSVKDIRIATVSKDMDAIMALGFGQVEAAIVTRASFDTLKKFFPDSAGKMHILQELKPVEFPKVVVFPPFTATKKLTEIFQRMSDKTVSKEVLKFFDITEFKPESAEVDNEK